MRWFRVVRSPKPVASFVLACVVTTVALAGCGSSSSTSKSTGASSKPTSSGAGLAEVTKVSKLAAGSGVFGPGSGDVTPSQLSSPTQSAIDVVPFTPGPSTGSTKVTIVPCPGATCTQGAALDQAIATKLGMKANVIVSAAYTPAAFQAAWNSAIAGKPNVIIGIATVGAAIGPQLAAAKKDGIYTVFVNGTTASGAGFDAYIPSGYNLSQVALGSEMAVQKGGEAKLLWLTAPEFPDLDVASGVKFLKSACTGCSVKFGLITPAQGTEPVATTQYTAAALRQNPGLNYVAFPSTDVNIPAAFQAVRSSPTAGVQLTAAGLTADAAAEVSSGQLPFAVGVPLEWIALQSIDAAIRGLKKLPAVPPVDRKIAAFLLPKSEVPSDPKATGGPLDRWALAKFDFVKPYSEAWHTDLSSVIAAAADGS